MRCATIHCSGCGGLFAQVEVSNENKPWYCCQACQTKSEDTVTRANVVDLINTWDVRRLYKMESVLDAALSDYIRSGSTDYKAEEDARLFLNRLHLYLVEELAAQGDYLL